MKAANPQAREHMLARIRNALGASEDDAERRYAVQKRLHDPPGHTVPGQGRIEGAAALDQLRAKLEGQGATFEEAATPQSVPGLVAAYLRAHNLRGTLATGSDDWLDALPWTSAPHLERRKGPAGGSEEASLSRAFAAVAETGTLVLTSGADNPTTLNFLPDTHIVVVRASSVTGCLEQVWERLERVHAHRNLPRTVNLVSGPSRTADIEQTIVMGAHGPRRLHVILVREETPGG